MTPLGQRSALIVGAGGLGSPAAMILARSGVGRLGVIDGDEVDVSNLHRQLLYRESDVGEPKVHAARRRLERLSAGLVIEIHQERLEAKNAPELFSSYDVILDGSDSFATRFLCNDAAVLMRKPLVHAGVVKREGQVLAIVPFQSACYRCLFTEPPARGEIPSCSEAGILGPVAGVIGAIQAGEALKLLTGFGTPLLNRLLSYDAAKQSFREVAIARDPDCAACASATTLKMLEPAKYTEAACAA